MPWRQMGVGELPGAEAGSHCVCCKPSPSPARSQPGPNAFSFLETMMRRTVGAVLVQGPQRTCPLIDLEAARLLIHRAWDPGGMNLSCFFKAPVILACDLPSETHRTAGRCCLSWTVMSLARFPDGRLHTVSQS